MMRIDLNCDLGEGGPYDAELLDLITSANIACGVHAGDAETMRRTAELALRKGVGIGAHPGLSGGFGRTERTLTPGEAYELTLSQVAALRAIAPLRHVKPHGALYTMAARDPALAEALARAVRAADPGLIFVGLAGSEMILAARAAGLEVAEEAFADRGYRPDGTLVPRGEPGALLESAEEAARRVVGLVREGRIDGVSMRADTICVHGDTPGAPDFVRALRSVLAREGVEVRSFG